ncbi:uncharacterized protein H6S33_011596 [Morchella sextelata]|uniref:uncharacterized protein n=1 Tax=Morchella sextelata TaxID=1174677 RepID=UPI001D055BF3|nr:uncharacterized protein H6S33_011596 [Morchella sextelata]KAH0611169.1 hypothetical protein H6S33_011596 [Morchella sextelata]
MMLPKFLFILTFVTGIIAQDALSPTDCVIECVDLVLDSGITDCVGPNKSLDPTRVPCLCEDFTFMKATVECVLNSGKCKDQDTIQRSFVYAHGLCDSAGVDLAGNSAPELPSVYGVLTSVSSTSTKKSTPTPTLVDEIVTTMISRSTSIACPLISGNATYTVMNGNTTYTTVPAATDARCGNVTETFDITYTRKVAATQTGVTTTTGTGSMTATDQPTATAERGGAGGIAELNAVGLLSFAGIIMWLL